MSPKIEPILQELRAEVPATRKVLERVPGDKLAWKPHTKSRSLGELAAHIAGVVGIAVKIATSDEFSPGGPSPLAAGSIEEIRSRFEEYVRSAEDALSKMTDESANAHWRLVFQGKQIFSKPRTEALRTNVLQPSLPPSRPDVGVSASAGRGGAGGLRTDSGREPVRVTEVVLTTETRRTRRT